MKTEIVPFTEGMLPEASVLLAKRHAANRDKQPLLPVRFTQEAVALKAVHALWERKSKAGYAAFQNGKMIAYILGEFSVQPWGRCGYVYLPGYALADGRSASIIQDLYAALGDEWVNAGVFSHGLYISAADRNVIDALFDVGFGKERVDALLDLRTAVIPEVEPPQGIVVRQAGPGDETHLGDISPIISNALANPPYWHPTVPEDYEELREGWSELACEQDWTVWLALDGDRCLGTVGFTSKEQADTDLLAGPATTYLSIAATHPEARGRGISTTLSWHGLAYAREHGAEVCYTNWISPNLLAARHWPRYGFTDVAYRLSKRVDPQITWAR